MDGTSDRGDSGGGENSSLGGKKEEISDADSKSPTTRNTLNKKSAVESKKLEIGPPRELHFNNLAVSNKCYIISNRFEEVPGCSLKTQYEIDEKNIGRTFSWLNFDVKLRRDLDYSQIDKQIRAICEKDYSEEQCLVLFILSHGTDEQEILSANRMGYKIETIIDKLQDVETLNDKPKLIFIQACRGTKEMEVVNAVRAAGNKPIRVAKKSNTFVYYSTMQGNKAYCSTLYGSFFIYALCEVLLDYYKEQFVTPRYHFGDVVTRVNDFLCTYVRDFKLQGEKDEKALVQVSEARSSLSQHIYFYPNPKTYEKYLKESNYTNKDCDVK